jgi:hypothetical protein
MLYQVVLDVFICLMLLLVVVFGLLFGVAEKAMVAVFLLFT